MAELKIVRVGILDSPFSKEPTAAYIVTELMIKAGFKTVPREVAANPEQVDLIFERN